MLKCITRHAFTIIAEARTSNSVHENNEAIMTER